MKKILNKKYIFFLLAICLLVEFTFGYFYFQQTKSLLKVNREISKTYQIINTTQDMINEINVAISKQRGYLLTNEAIFKGQFRDSVFRAIDKISVLKYITKDNERQHIEVLQLEKQFNDRLVFLTSLNLIAETKGLNEAIKIIGLKKNIFSFDHLRTIAADIIKTEEQLLTERNLTAIQDNYRIIHVIVIGNVITLVIIGLCFVLLNAQLKRQLKAEKKLKYSKQELFKLAYFNPVTDLPNRAFLVKKLKEEIENSRLVKQSITVFCLNLDDFKNINDSFGYELGDNILKIIAMRLKSFALEKHLLAHFGSDEFALLIINMTTTDTIALAKNILAAVEEKILIQNHHITLTASIGICNNMTHLDPEFLIKNATIAMHAAKEHGKNTFQFCSVELKSEVEERALLGYYLQQAINQNEFILLYQPKFKLKENCPNGIEVLIRWQRPHGLTIYPDRFISLAEKNGSIIQIGEWMLRTACRQMKKWQEMGLGMSNIAINISPVQITNGNFVETVKKVLDETKLNPDCLELELTENILIKNVTSNIAILTALKNMGVHITIDDFGTGFSSLSYFRFLSIDKLKIDQSFINEITSADQNSPIIYAIILMAHSLNIKVIAEGVETQAQIDFLKKTQCNEVQGFFYSKPLTADEVEILYRNYCEGKLPSQLNND